MKKILIVEDDVFISEMYANKLQKAGFEVISVRDGQEAITKLEEIGPDLVLLDIVLPKIDGFEVLKTIKTDPKFKKIKVALLTNLGEGENIKKGLELGADAYLIKAHSIPSEIIEKVKEILESN